MNTPSFIPIKHLPYETKFIIIKLINQLGGTIMNEKKDHYVIKMGHLEQLLRDCLYQFDMVEERIKTKQLVCMDRIPVVYSKWFFLDI